MRKFFTVTCSLVFLVISIIPAFAAEETQAIYSPKCKPEKLQKIGGKAIVKVEKGGYEGGYNITLETKQMNWQELTQKMSKAGCF